jgi:hypothetical protein
VVRLRRGDVQARRLALAEEKWERQKEGEEPETPRAAPMRSPEERRRFIDDIYGLVPKPNVGSAAGQRGEVGSRAMGQVSGPAKDGEPVNL